MYSAICFSMLLTLQRQLLPYGYSYKGIKHPLSDQVKLSYEIFDIWALWHSSLSVRVPGCQKITNDSLTRSGTGCL